MDTTALEDIGLSKTEVKVFLTISRLGECRSGKVIEKSGLQSSSIFNSINSLISKGLVSYIKRSDVKYYKAAEPEAILDYIESKKQEYLKILPALKEEFKPTSEEGVEYFRSIKGIKSLISELMIDSKPGDEYLTFAIEDPEEYQTARDKVFSTTKVLSQEKKLKMKGIFSEKIRYAPTRTTRMQKRYLSIPLPPNTLILNDKVAIILWKGQEPSGILIRSSEIANKYKLFFNHLWEIGKK